MLGRGVRVIPTFTFYLHDGPTTIPAFEIQLLDQDSDALAYGRKLLAERPRYSAVVITEGEREVGELERSTPAVDRGRGAS